MQRGTVARWTGAAFLDEARAWTGRRLDAVGIQLTGAWEQPHVRTWSSAVRFATTAGNVWFKVNGPGTRHEPGLLRLLGEREVDLLPEVLAVDIDRGWSLCRDGGPTMRAALPPERSWSAWEGVVARYAEAQVRLSDARDAVLATGAREVSVRTVSALASRLVDELSGQPVDRGGLSADQRHRLLAGLPELTGWCDELAASPVPDSVQHDDLHSANVCWNGSVATARIIDWGDTTWTCPLTTMLGTMRSLAFYAGLTEESPEVLRVRDAYLEPFTGYDERAGLVHLVDLARRTGCVGKALSYRAVLQDAEPADVAELGFPVREWLLTLLAD